MRARLHIFYYGEEERQEDDPWTVLEGLIGTVEGPEDLASEHEQYLYGARKQS